MSTSIEKNTGFNPYAAPLRTSVQPQLRLERRASIKKITEVNRLAIVADLSYVALCCSWGLGLYFLPGEVGQYSMVAFGVTLVWVTLFLLCLSMAAAIFTVKGFSIESILTPFVLAIPLIGTFVFLFEKERLREFMIGNGYRPRFLGFVADDAQRQAMDEDLNYTPSQSTHHDGSKRRYVFSLSECLILLGISGYLLMELWVFISIKLQF